MCSSEVARKMWIRLRSAWRTASHARSTSLNPVRDSPAMIGPRTVFGDRLHGFEVAVAGDREPGLDDVDPEARELLRDLELLADVERDAGRLLAVPQGRVEDQHLVPYIWLTSVFLLRNLVPETSFLQRKASPARRHREKASASTPIRCSQLRKEEARPGGASGESLSYSVEPCRQFSLAMQLDAPPPRVDRSRRALPRRLQARRRGSTREEAVVARRVRRDPSAAARCRSPRLLEACWRRESGITWDPQPFPSPRALASTRHPTPTVLRSAEVAAGSTHPEPAQPVHRQRAGARRPPRIRVGGARTGRARRQSVKAKLSSGIFHAPGAQMYERTKADRC